MNFSEEAALKEVPMRDRAQKIDTFLWPIRALALLSLGIVTFLLWQKVTGRISSIAGCGGDAGCAQILGGRWSQWFGIPVTALAAALYISVILLTVRPIRRFNPPFANIALLTSGMIAMFAAIWFIGVLVFAEQAFCPYCLATHVFGFSMGVFILKACFADQNESASNTKGPSDRRGKLANVLAIFAIAALATGQIFGPRPETHIIADIDISHLERLDLVEFDQTTAPSIDSVSYVDGLIRFDVSESPHLGNPLAPHVITKMFDYTCETCRLMHFDLKKLEEAHPGKFLIIISPCPLNRKCNRHFKGNSQEHESACEYAQLAWTLWRAKPAQFPTFHEFLMTGESPPPLAEARAVANQLAGREAMEAAARDPWIEKRLQRSVNNYLIIVRDHPRMPVLLLGGNKILSGLFFDKEEFIQTIEKHFNIQ